MINLGKLFFSQIDPVVKLGQERILQPDDFEVLPRELDPRFIPFNEKAIGTSRPWSFLTSLIIETRSYFLRMFAYNWGYIAVMLACPALLNRLVKLAGKGLHTPEALAEALTYGALLGSCGLIAGLCAQWYFYESLVIKQIFTNYINKKIFEHSLYLTNKAKLQSPTGDIVNHMSSDCDVVADLPLVLGDISIAILTIIGASISLFFIFGSTAFLSLGMMILLIPLTRRLAVKFTYLEDQLMHVRDQRITLMTQILNGIRIVKYFVWEDSVKKEVDVLRQRELLSRWKLVKAESVASVGYLALSVIILFVSFAVHVMRGGQLDASSVFTAVALFQLLAEPFGHLSQHVSRVVYAVVGAQRILQFLAREVLPIRKNEESAEAPSVAFEHASVEIDGRTILQDINFSLPKGASLAIVGPVGSGKTTLLHLLLGEIPTSQGSLKFNDCVPVSRWPRFSYVPQEAFIINDTLRANILFGHHGVSPEELGQAIELTSLSKDIAALPAGLETEIGERGVNLSGGQKQRVSLARAILHNPGIILLDDPLSAVDPRTELLLVGRLLFGAWKNKTRIVVTHRLAHLRRFDRIAFIHNGRVESFGSFDQVWEQNEAFRSFVSDHVENVGESVMEETPALGRPVSTWGTDADVEAMSRLTDVEERQIGAVKTGVYFDYLWALGGKTKTRTNLFLLMLGITAVVLAPLLQRLWLAKSSQPLAPGAQGIIDLTAANPPSAVLIYGIIGFIGLMFMILNDIYWIRRGLVAGRDMHDDMLNSVLGARLRFFDATPIGRVLQRFSRDVESIDVFLQDGYKQTILIFVEIIVSLFLILSVLPVMIMVILPVGYLYYRVQDLYRGPARESKRLDAISRSPRYAHFKETLQGLVVIRSFGKTDLFLHNFYNYLGHSQRMFRAMYMLNRWFSSRIPLLGSIVAVSSIFGLIMASRSGHLNSGMLGVMLVYLLTFWQILNRAIRWFSELEARMTSVERVKFYSALDTEQPSQVVRAMDWPKGGSIVFENVSVRYADHLPDVLKDLTFKIEAGQKVGIIGRTGSGKSTIIQTLFRCMELSKGKIFIDDQDISKLPLAQLRKAIAIIPQDPILFVGSLRSNLDRYNEHTDQEIWNALERANLDSMVKSLPQDLDSAVVENGMNFSQGQRQLLCLARALLCRASIIVMDEATASVDVETDDLVQKVIRESCSGITMLIIAHRLATVEDADLIIELERGRLKELRKGKAN